LLLRRTVAVGVVVGLLEEEGRLRTTPFVRDPSGRGGVRLVSPSLGPVTRRRLSGMGRPVGGGRPGPWSARRRRPPRRPPRRDERPRTARTTRRPRRGEHR